MTLTADDDLKSFLASVPTLAQTAHANPTTTVPAPIKPPAHERHTCLECNGTGFYQGKRIHQEKAHCFACKGKGWFKTSYAERFKARTQAQTRKVNALTEAQNAFREAHPGLIEGLEAIGGWHQFAQSLLAGFAKWGSLTEGQTRAAQSALLKVEAKRAERAETKAAKTGDVGVEAIEALFATAKSNGLQRPRFITERLVISRAPAHGKNAGALYVKCDGEYAGKIAAGTFHPVNSAPADILTLVREIAASPVEAARKYGRDTGTCSCCGRLLVDPVSVANGIGPICAGKWGF